MATVPSGNNDLRGCRAILVWMMAGALLWLLTLLAIIGLAQA